MKLYCICWIAFLMLLIISPLIAQIDDLHNNDFEKRNINKDTINKKYRPRLSLGIGSPELFNVGLAMKLNKLQLGGILGGFKSSEESFLQFNYRILGLECTYINILNPKNKDEKPTFLRFNYYYRKSTYSSYIDYEKYFLILSGKEYKNIHLHYGILFRIKGRREHFYANPLSEDKEYNGIGPPIWPTAGIRYILQ